MTQEADAEEIAKISMNLWAENMKRLEQLHRDIEPSRREIEAADNRGRVSVDMCREYTSQLPTNLADAIEWLSLYLAKVPEGQRADAEIEFENSEYSSEVIISYWRDETDEEWAMRKADVMRRKAIWEKRNADAERAEFDRLKAKFG